MQGRVAPGSGGLPGRALRPSQEGAGGAGGAAPRRVYDGARVLHPNWSPDDTNLFFFGDDQLYFSGADFVRAQPVAKDKKQKVSDLGRVEWVK